MADQEPRTQDGLGTNGQEPRTKDGPGVFVRSCQGSRSAGGLFEPHADVSAEGAKRLAELADAHIPAPVIDMMVALAYPDAFAVPPSPTTVGALVGPEPRRDGGAASLDPFDCGFDFSLYGFGGCSPFASSSFGFLPFGSLAYGFLPYAYSRFGYGPYDFGGGYGGWYASTPTVIIKPGEPTTHGQVVNGRGYSSGGAGTSATPTSSDSGSSSGSSGGSVGAASSGGGGDRTAHPR